MTMGVVGVDMLSAPSIPAAAKAPRSAAPLLLSEERVAGGLGRRGPRRAHAGDGGHDLRLLLQVATDQFGECPVGDAEPDVHRLQLVIHEYPGTSCRLRDRQRLEKGGSGGARRRG